MINIQIIQADELTAQEVRDLQALQEIETHNLDYIVLIDPAHLCLSNVTDEHFVDVKLPMAVQDALDKQLVPDETGRWHIANFRGQKWGFGAVYSG